MRASRIQLSGRHRVTGTRPCYQRAPRRTSASGPRAGENTSGAATSASGIADFRLGRREALQGAGLLLLAQAAPAGAAAGALSTAAPVTQQTVVTRRKVKGVEGGGASSGAWSAQKPRACPCLGVYL